MGELYISQKALEEYLEKQYSSIKETVEEYKNKPSKPGTIEDGGQIGMMEAYKHMLNFISYTNIFRPNTFYMAENEAKERIDFAEQMKILARNICENSDDKFTILNFIDHWLEYTYEYKI